MPTKKTKTIKKKPVTKSGVKRVASKNAVKLTKSVSSTKKKGKIKVRGRELFTTPRGTHDVLPADALVRNKIIDVTLKEDEILQRIGKGIFYMPELAFAYTVGKEIYLNRKRIFDNQEVEWLRESKIKRQGEHANEIFDLIFEIGKNTIDNTIVIEFKMPDKKDKYKMDIEKLHRIQNLPVNYTKIFCALFTGM